MSNAFQKQTKTDQNSSLSIFPQLLKLIDPRRKALMFNRPDCCFSLFTQLYNAGFAPKLSDRRLLFVA
jgi:hypothetical protein